jgi:hypothetical protein
VGVGVTAVLTVVLLTLLLAAVAVGVEIALLGSVVDDESGAV